MAKTEILYLFTSNPRRRGSGMKLINLSIPFNQLLLGAKYE